MKPSQGKHQLTTEHRHLFETLQSATYAAYVACLIRPWEVAPGRGLLACRGWTRTASAAASPSACQGSAAGSPWARQARRWREAAGARRPARLASRAPLARSPPASAARSPRAPLA
ncbi:hypothetical protein SEVIR_2G032350v4 [Setaria viridis]